METDSPDVFQPFSLLFVVYREKRMIRWRAERNRDGLHIARSLMPVDSWAHTLSLFCPSHISMINMEEIYVSQINCQVIHLYSVRCEKQLFSWDTIKALERDYQRTFSDNRALHFSLKTRLSHVIQTEPHLCKIYPKRANSITMFIEIVLEKIHETI